MELLKKPIEDYIATHSEAESELLQQINRETHLQVLKPRMLSGYLQGNILTMFSRMIRPNRILEIGTYTGYSALCLAEGLTEDGILHTIDVNFELENRVRNYFEKSPYSTQIQYHVGNAMQIIPKLEENFDLVFIDADKLNYSNYFDLVIDKIRSGGFIIADNVLWSGKVIYKAHQDKDTKALRRFNQKVREDERVFSTIFPIRDGLNVICKK